MDYVKTLEQKNDELQKRLAYYESHKTLNIPTIENEYTDRDEVMLHAVFAVLVEFVEEEWHGVCEQYDQAQIDMETDENGKDTLILQNKEKKDLWELYLWWKNEYPKLWADPHWHFKGYEIETEKAMQVVALRKYLWT